MREIIRISIEGIESEKDNLPVNIKELLLAFASKLDASKYEDLTEKEVGVVRNVAFSKGKPIGTPAFVTPKYDTLTHKKGLFKSFIERRKNVAPLIRGDILFQPWKEDSSKGRTYKCLTPTFNSPQAKGEDLCFDVLVGKDEDSLNRIDGFFSVTDCHYSVSGKVKIIPLHFKLTDIVNVTSRMDNESKSSVIVSLHKADNTCIDLEFDFLVANKHKHTVQGD